MAVWLAGDKSLDVLLGTGKVKPSAGIISSMLQCSAQTTSPRIQLALTHKLIKKGRATLGAPKGKKVDTLSSLIVIVGTYAGAGIFFKLILGFFST